MIEEAIKKLEAEELAALAKQIAERILTLRSKVAHLTSELTKEQTLIKRGLELDLINKDEVDIYLKDIKHLDYATGNPIYFRTG